MLNQFPILEPINNASPESKATMTSKAHRAIRRHSQHLMQRLCTLPMDNAKEHAATYNAHAVAIHYSRALRPSR